MTQAWDLVLHSMKSAFDKMAAFQLFPGLNLLQFLVICLVIDVCLALFFSHMPRVSVDSAMQGLLSTASKERKAREQQKKADAREQYKAKAWQYNYHNYRG